jgi:hypothetical protein
MTVTVIVTVTDNLKKLKNRELMMMMMMMQNGTCTAKFRGTTTISLNEVLS